MKNYLLVISLITILASCNETSNQTEKRTERKPMFDSIYTTFADGETVPINALSKDDAADDPAVWIHPTLPEKSVIYGSNKKMGISVYDLDGKEIYFYPFGRINNIDVIYNYELNGSKIDLCGFSNRTLKSVDIYKINQQTGELIPILEDTVFSAVDDTYGFCFYRSAVSKKYYVFISGKNGEVEQYEIINSGEKIKLGKIRTLKFDSQTEGMVADHYHGFLYVGEEDSCIWKVGAEPDNNYKIKINNSETLTNKNIKYDIEGLSIYFESETEGYLIASSQGNNSYAIYERNGENKYIGSFRIGNGKFDDTEETDGIDIVSENLGSKFPYGMFIAQDGENRNDSIISSQNFKYLRWENAANLFTPPLSFKNNFKIRNLFK